MSDLTYVDRHRQRFEPFKLSLWDRALGSTFLPYEIDRLREISKAKSMDRPDVSGYVRTIDSGRFALLPTQTTHQDYLVCTCRRGVEPPRQNDYIRVNGITKYSTVEAGRILARSEVLVEDWYPEKPELPQIDLNMTFRDFRNEMFSRFPNVEPLVSELLAYEVVSSPSFLNQEGGLNICLYDATPNKLALRLVRDLQRMIPSDLGRKLFVRVPMGGRFSVEYKYNLIVENADRLPRQIARRLRDRRIRETSRETSFSLGSRLGGPRELTDEPAACSDFPTVLNEEVDVLRGRLDPNLDAFKYVLAHQFYDPMLPEAYLSMDYVQSELPRLRESYEVPEQQLARFGVLDSSCWGKPSAVIRVALAEARASGLQQVSIGEVRRAYRSYFEKNFNYVYEFWHDTFKTGGGLDFMRLSVEEREICRIVERNQATGSCVPYKMIGEEMLGINPLALRALVDDLSRAGWLVESRPDCYRVMKI